MQRWKEHFESVLNVSSVYSEDVIETLHQQQVRDEMAEPPTEEEIDQAIGSLKRHKAGGKNGILPEIVKSCGPSVMDNILDLFHTIWRAESVPSEWRNAKMVPIPKKGNLSICDNWRGISLLDVIRKVFAKVIQRRLQDMVEEVVSDSQCGFRKDRGCVDMIFCARQLIEKAREHDTQVYMLFVDLRKAYDSVPGRPYGQSYSSTEYLLC